MNRLRAEEIAQSPDLQHVTYNGIPIYIQRVNEENETARVFALNDPQNEFDVQLTSLHEK
ncbi:H-type small acid-soluble spore protein [Lederbergia citrea]|uniref:Small, acid-soluble spore protein H n=1 Tax=Lederbergia citrea TaxID=2833581 RepID=A0A942Z5U1_9BACI|nr:H-type small acid-soluble spore protein [Lederbergia citrea]MBS4177805.1 H-type small acid-soluble spore protein [Lederbergia citrea]MBS4204478.1 H-type small acid-soluble spore protein [Lederbergia citrea]MBS4223677.1 H-type small acid-soluble spore protein [Lederbergia citrea]